MPGGSREGRSTRSREGRSHGADSLAGRRPVLEALRAGSSIERIFFSKDIAPSKILGDIRKRAEAASVPVRVVPRSQVDKLAEGANHQGVVAVTGRYRYTPLESILGVDNPKVLFLDGVTDPHNLGSLLRSADVSGFSGIVLPARRSAGVNAAARRISAGAAEVVPVARVTNLGQAVDAGRAAGLWLVGMDSAGDGDLWTSTMLEPPLGLILGSEDKGMSRVVRERCDEIVRIPLAGRLGSLNVSVAGAVAMFEVARRSQSSSL